MRDISKVQATIDEEGLSAALWGMFIYILLEFPGCSRQAPPVQSMKR
jgi:hypothetical protein